MAEQIRFFRKNWADFEREYVSASATNGDDMADQVLTRSNKTGWGTSGSTDAEQPVLTIDLGDSPTIDTIILVNHNWKNYKLQYLASDGVTWTDFSPSLAHTTNTENTTIHEFTALQTSSVRAIIYGTMVADAEKYLSQFIITSALGQFNGWPAIRTPVLGRNLQEQNVISGKANILQNLGRYSASIVVQVLSDSTDLALIETLFSRVEGFLYWPCGGDEDQFSSVRQGYRLVDIYLVRCRNEFSPEWYKGLYKSGQVVRMDLVEVVT